MWPRVERTVKQTEKLAIRLRTDRDTQKALWEDEIPLKPTLFAGRHNDMKVLFEFGRQCTDGQVTQAPTPQCECLVPKLPPPPPRSDPSPPPQITSTIVPWFPHSVVHVPHIALKSNGLRLNLPGAGYRKPPDNRPQPSCPKVNYMKHMDVSHQNTAWRHYITHVC